MRRVALTAAFLVLATATPAKADVSDHLTNAWDIAEAAAIEARIWTERAIIAGGVVLNRNRHTVSGAVIGCAAGSAVGAASAAVAGAATGGAALLGTPQAALLGCGLGASAGAAMGYPLDHLFDE